MKITPDKADSDKFKVESESSKGKFYHVNIAQPFCDCPAFIMTEMKRHGECKHIKAAKEYALDHGKAPEDGRGEKIIAYVKEKGEVDSIGLINKFGEKEVNALIARGELFEQHGKIRLL